MTPSFPNLFSPLTIRSTRFRNRVFSTGHMTTLVSGGLPNDDLVAYHEARAAGGAALVIVEVAAVHETAIFTTHTIDATSDDCIPGYRAIAEAAQRHDCRVFGQLFHPGREIIESIDGSTPVSFAPSATPNERFHVTPRALPSALVAEIVAGYGDAARRFEQAGLDGVEIVASHGYLPAQFLNPRVNRRQDRYGGDAAGRLRFLSEIAADIRAKVGPEFIVGLRISGDEKALDGLTPDEATAACVALDAAGAVDYLNVIAGSSATLAGSIHIVPPMTVESAYLAPYAAAVRARVSVPVFVAGRINRPHEAEQVIAAGQADMCGMTRAQICDPELANKAREGRVDDIRVCIGCNQACIGHMLGGYPISCIQHPESGRERRYLPRRKAPAGKKVVIAGGGPGGMKAAAVAAERGHRVTLYERSGELGGQALLARLLPGRAEFGGIVSNLEREMVVAGVEVRRNEALTRDLVEREAPDAVIVATGARPRPAQLEGEGHVVEAWQVIRDEANVGASVLVADWRCDWIGLGVAEKLARAGCQVRLAVNGYMPGQAIQQYVRDHWVGVLHRLGVTVIPYARLFGVDRDTVYLQHTTSGEPIVVEGVDTVVAALGHESVSALELELEGWGGEVLLVGDCLAPRTAEEAVFEGLKAGTEI